MKIRLKPNVFIKLEAVRVAVGGLEYSGLGFVDVIKEGEETVFEVYDVVLMDVGSSVFTEIPAEKILPLMDRPDAKKMKLWFHRHPVGNETPGKHNWSGTDEDTATKTPLGGVPDMVKWALSIVRTPQTWVGRIDRFKDGAVQTVHLPVVWNTDREFVAEAITLRDQYLLRLAKETEEALKHQKEAAILATPFGGIKLKLVYLLEHLQDFVTNLREDLVISTFRGTRNKKENKKNK